MKKNKITVVGIFVVDISVYSKKLPLPGETILGENYIIGPGGKGSNQAVAIAKAGGEVSLIARIGNDDFGKVGINLYEDVGVKKDSLIIDESERTGCATISIDEKGMNAIVVVPSSANGLSPEMIDSKIGVIKNSKIVITGFEVPINTTSHALKIARKNHCINILNPAPFILPKREIWSLVDYLTPNEHEASEITGLKIDGPQAAFEAGKILCNMGVKNAVITLGELGAVTVIEGKKGDHYYPPNISASVVDTVGAGDVFNGTFALALSRGETIEKSVKFANISSAISVRRKGAAKSAPNSKEISEIYSKI